jgi:hypothetical protein
VFHPYYRGGYEFLRLDDETLDGKVMNRIQFRHVRGAPSTTSFRLRERDFPLDLQGTAWIEPDSARIARIDVGLTAPLTDLGLQSLRADVRYDGLQLKSSDQIHWLPSTATVEVETARQHWRNNHRFADYRQFSVKSESVVSP